MGSVKFSNLTDGQEIDLTKVNLFVDAGISAADVDVKQNNKDVQFFADGKTIFLTNWTLEQINTTSISFSNKSELLIGDDNIAVVNDVIANVLQSSRLDLDRNDQLRGLGGNDILLGGAGDDMIFGNGGDDTIDGGTGKDHLYGGNGDDTIFGGAARDYIYGIGGAKGGNDTVDGGEGNDRIVYSDQDETTHQTIDGGAGKDHIDGGQGDDILMGGAGNDVIDGHRGADIITGGLGKDLIIGNEGGDTIVANSADTPAEKAKCDVLRAFHTGSDHFDLPVAGTNTNYTEDDINNDSFAKAFARAEQLFQAGDGTITYVYIAGETKGYLFGDLVGGDLAPDLAIEIGNGVSLDQLAFSDII